MTSQAMRLSIASKAPTVPKLRTLRVMFPPPRTSTGTSSARISATGWFPVATAVASAKRPPSCEEIVSWEPTGTYSTSVAAAKTSSRPRSVWVWPSTATWQPPLRGTIIASTPLAVTISLLPGVRASTRRPVCTQSSRAPGSMIVS